jgi:6-pyruvoyltetrahydropterin/6-carboxytetrahydropterin synthase
MLLRATKIFKFSSAHRLPYHAGKCKELHGHNYKLEVTFMGEPQPDEGPESGMVVDFSKIKKEMMINISKWDHHFLNDTLNNPTAEIMVSTLVHDLVVERKLPVVAIKLYETETCHVEWRIEDNVSKGVLGVSPIVKKYTC